MFIGVKHRNSIKVIPTDGATSERTYPGKELHMLLDGQGVEENGVLWTDADTSTDSVNVRANVIAVHSSSARSRRVESCIGVSTWYELN